MAGIINGILGAMLLISCSVNRVSNPIKDHSKGQDQHVQGDTVNAIAEKSKTNVKIIVRQYHPYCGGAAPTPDRLNNYSNYGDELIVTRVSDSTRSVLKSYEGEYLAFLPPGKYVVMEKYKDVEFEEFVNTYRRSGTYYMDSSDDCYKLWWKSNILSFEIIHEDTLISLEATINANCFTGINPCVQYTGPYPP